MGMTSIKGRFENAGHAELVLWAREYLRGHLEMLERAHTDEFGRIRPAETRIELKLLKAWVDRAGNLLERRHRLDAALGARLDPLPAGASLEDALTKGYPANQA
jgi:hypothetical protein